ncbi:hypothetical protein K469DRAFT_608400, partial [Zopfia rhizophila CBS 207.26]
VFDPDAESFNPHQWNSIRPGQRGFLLFSGSAHTCLGKDKVLIEVAFLLIRLAQEFKELRIRDERPRKGLLTLTYKNGHGRKIAFMRDR